MNRAGLVVLAFLSEATLAIPAFTRSFTMVGQRSTRVFSTRLRER
jgi:hypothetical protein